MTALMDERAELLAALVSHPHVLQHVERLNEYGADERTVEDTDAANVITSEIAAGPDAGRHTVVLDIDHPAALVPSSTPGHYHLFIDVPPMHWSTYRELLSALARAGVIEDGYEAASIARQNTAVRLPWIKKGSPDSE